MNPTLLHRITALESEMDAEHDMLAQCVRSGQVDSRQIVAHSEAGELDLRPLVVQPVPRDIGYEAALHPLQIVTDELTPLRDSKPAREPIDWQLVGIYAAVAVCFLLVAILSTWR